MEKTINKVESVNLNKLTNKERLDLKDELLVKFMRKLQINNICEEEKSKVKALIKKVAQF